MQEGVGGRLPGQTLPLGDDAVHLQLEEAGEAGRVQDRAAVPARRDDGPAHPVPPQVADHLDGAGNDLHPLARQHFVEKGLLAVPEAADRLARRRVVGRTAGDGDAARGEEGAHAVVARPAIDEARVVARLEAAKRLVARGRAPREIVVEEPGPGRGVQARGGRQHPVEVEQDRLVAGPLDHGNRGRGFRHRRPPRRPDTARRSPRGRSSPRGSSRGTAGGSPRRNRRAARRGSRW